MRPLPQEERGASLMCTRYSSGGGALPGLGPSPSLAELLEQPPAPRYSRGSDHQAGGAAEQQASDGGQHRPDALMSALYRPSDAAPAAAGAAHRQQQRQAAALQALQQPSPLVGAGKAGDERPRAAAISVRADATAAAAAAQGGEAHPLSHMRRSISMPEQVGPVAPAAGTAVHPKYAAIVQAARAAEAAGTARRPASRSTSPAKAPASPLPVAARRPLLSKAGSGVSVGGSGATPRRASVSGVDARALDARILEAQRSGGAAALAAAVRASLADHDEQLLRHASARLSRLSGRSLATPRTPGTSRLALALTEAPEDVAGEPGLRRQLASRVGRRVGVVSASRA